MAPEPGRAADHHSADYDTADYDLANYDWASYDWSNYDTANYGDRALVEWREEPSTSRKIFDAAILRPFQFGQLLVSAVIFVPAYAVAWPFGVEDDVTELCITEPTDRLFRKSLGDL